jgi:hypothetical protein
MSDAFADASRFVQHDDYWQSQDQPEYNNDDQCEYAGLKYRCYKECNYSDCEHYGKQDAGT